jgi:hypothetical protein
VNFEEDIGVSVLNHNFNSVAISLILVNCVENSRKIKKKCKTNFFRFMVNDPTTFVILA